MTKWMRNWANWKIASFECTEFRTPQHAAVGRLLASLVIIVLFALYVDVLPSDLIEIHTMVIPWVCYTQLLPWFILIFHRCWSIAVSSFCSPALWLVHIGRSSWSSHRNSKFSNISKSVYELSVSVLHVEQSILLVDINQLLSGPDRTNPCRTNIQLSIFGHVVCVVAIRCRNSAIVTLIWLRRSKMDSVDDLTGSITLDKIRRMSNTPTPCSRTSLPTISHVCVKFKNVFIDCYVGLIVPTYAFPLSTFVDNETISFNPFSKTHPPSTFTAEIEADKQVSLPHY